MNLKKIINIQLLVIYEETKRVSIKKEIENWGVDDWCLLSGNIVPDEFKNLPNYITAQEIRSSPLFRAMQEEE